MIGQHFELAERYAAFQARLQNVSCAVRCPSICDRPFTRSSSKILESKGESDIASDEIGQIVMEALARIDTVAYVRFASVYKNFQEADDFEEFVAELRPPQPGDG